MRYLAIGLAAASLAVCAPAASDPAQLAKTAGKANAPADPCPQEQLSCGKQRPVRSNGRTRFRNDEFGLSALFPAGAPVCMSRSGDSPRGFYTRVGSAQALCETGGFPRAMGLSAYWNSLDYETLTEAAGGSCTPVSEEVRKAFGARPPAFPGHRSLACQELKDGRIEITVYTLAGRLQEGGSISTVFWAFLATTPDHLADDARTFQAFLKNSRIGWAK